MHGVGSKLHPEWKRWRCEGCEAFGYINDPSPKKLPEVYESAWSESEINGAFATGSTDDKIANSLLKAVGFFENDSDDTVCLDYGGGTGHFAKVLFQSGSALTVYEPYRKNPGLPKTVHWLSDANDIPEKSFDWIFMIEVVEHLLDPLEELSNIFCYLAPGGRLIITTPTAKGWRAKLDKFNWRETQNPTHINLGSI